MLASLARRIVGLREGTRKCFSFVFPRFRVVSPTNFSILRDVGVASVVRKRVGHRARWWCRIYNSGDMYTRAHAAQHLKAHSWTRMRLRARTSSLFIGRDIKAYARHQTAPVVVNFVTTWLPVAAARLFMWDEGSFARRKKALNAATVRKVNNFAVETAAPATTARPACILFEENISQRRWSDCPSAKECKGLSFPEFLIVRNRCNVHNRNCLAFF